MSQPPNPGEPSVGCRTCGEARSDESWDQLCLTCRERFAEDAIATEKADAAARA